MMRTTCWWLILLLYNYRQLESITWRHPKVCVQLVFKVLVVCCCRSSIPIFWIKKVGCQWFETERQEAVLANKKSAKCRQVQKQASVCAWMLIFALQYCSMMKALFCTSCCMRSTKNIWKKVKENTGRPSHRSLCWKKVAKNMEIW